MSLDYELEIETSLAPNEVLEFLLRSVDLDAPIAIVNPESPQPKTIYRAVCLDFTVTSKQIRPNEQLSTDLGVTATIRVSFRTGGAGCVETARIATSMSAIWLKQIEGDFAFMYQGEWVYLYRKQGKLVLNAAAELWDASHLALITIPYTMEEIPVL